MEKIKNILKKFNFIPEQVNHEDFFGFPTKFLGLIFYDFKFISSARNWKEKKSFIIRRVVSWCILSNVLMYTMSLMLDTFNKPYNVQKIAFGVMPNCVWTTLGAKMLQYSLNKKKILDLIESLKEFYPKNQNSITNKYFKLAKLLERGTISILIFCTTIVVFSPLFVFLYSGKVLMPLPFAKSIYDPTQNFAYPFFYGWQVLVSLQGSLISIAYDLMTFTIIMTIALEWSILEQDFRKFYS